MTTALAMLVGLFPVAAQSPHPATVRGYQSMQAGNLSAAERAFKAALADAPSKEALFGLGTVYIKTWRYHSALDILEALAVEYPDDYYIKNNVAWIYAIAEDTQIRNGLKSVKLAQEALLIQPGSYHVWSTLSEGYYVSGRYEKALRAAQEALRLSIKMKASRKNIHTYQKQVDKCEKAQKSLTLIE